MEGAPISGRYHQHHHVEIVDLVVGFVHSVKQDKSMSAMVQNDSEKSWMEPLLQLRNDLTEKDFEKRDFRRLKGHVQLMGAEDEEKLYQAPYTKNK